MTPRLDFPDLLFLGGILLVAGGASLYSPPAGLIVLGVAMMIPTVAAALQGPPERK